MPPDGFLNLLKPPGMTSHDVVSVVRARLGLRRVGHLGTLDPAAAGVLPVSLGRATRLFQFAVGSSKTYRAEVAFGITTDTLDAEGEVVEVKDSGELTEAQVRDLLPGFVGEIEQKPPAFSAARVDGKRLHRMARQGRPREGRPRVVTIERLELVSFLPGPRAKALLEIVCGPGTYVRVVAAELGRKAGCGACLGFLVRTAVGRFEVSESLTLEELEAACEGESWQNAVLPPEWPLIDLPAEELCPATARAFAQGTCVQVQRPPGWPVRAHGPGEEFLGLGEVVEGGRMKPRIVLAGEGSCER